MSAFTLFGPDHILALLGTAVAALTLTLIVRRDPWGILGVSVRVGLALYHDEEDIEAFARMAADLR